jgi:uncharacterized repeat protein (TIGR02543 family)
MFEFLEDDVSKEVFTFSVPPESEDFEFPQRVSETKTFGGTAIDDYGSDSVKISLSGSTINEERKLIYRGNKMMPKYLTGEKEIFELQKIIDEWGQIEKLSKKKVYLYDLSKMSLIQITTGSPARNYWRVVIKNLKIKRSKDKPRTFNYTLEMTGIADKEKKLDPLFPDGVTDVLNKCQEALEAFQMIYEAMEVVSDVLDSVAGAILDTKNAFDKIGKAKGISIAGSVFDAPMRIITGDSNNSVYNSAKALVAHGGKLLNLFDVGSSGTSQTGTTSKDDEFAISFNTNGGSYLAPKKVTYGNVAERPPDPVRQKYSFSGWYTDADLTEEFDFSTEIAENITLYAKWTQVSATITFNSRQGTAVPAQSVDIGGRVEVPDPAPTRNGYVFEYWCTDSLATTEYDFSSVVSDDMALYARWRTVYSVNFVSNGGSAVERQTIDVGGKAIYPLIPNRNNYLFMYWCTDIPLTTEYDFNSTITGNLTLYAKWTQVSNTVTFNSNGGSSVSSQTVQIGHYATRPTNPTKEGYSFIRWCSDYELTEEFIFDTTEVNSPLTLYAAWSVNEYTISFEPNGGSEVTEQKIAFRELAIYPVNPIKSGYLFKRWCTDIELTAEFDFSTPVTSDQILYADWYGG